MHEASIVQSLIELVCQNVPDPAAVRRVDVRVGLLSGVSPDSMQFYFGLMREDSLSPRAELVVTLEPLQARCEGCRAEHSLSETVWLCPSCGERSLEFRNGDEMHLHSIEVEDGEGIHA
ncbi:MAG TPA: hydrogenase maturation nickel metallochaperone HypA [Bryobacteraceae bacterium]|nr:hydrogenase maturation nickel metallochaperone HypA [Bryobacteraceae bacterium]